MNLKIITPSRGIHLSWITAVGIKRAVGLLNGLNYKVHFGKYVYQNDFLDSALIEKKLEDFNNALSEDTIDVLLFGIGGFNCIELLDKLDYDSIHNSKVKICGSSDTTVLLNAIYAITGKIVYFTPMFYFFTLNYDMNDSLRSFQQCMQGEPYSLLPANYWIDDKWDYLNNSNKIHSSEGFWIINEGAANGIVQGGNISSYVTLQGSKYCPKLDNTILILETIYDFNYFTKFLQAIFLQDDSKEIKGILIGRFRMEFQIPKIIILEYFKKQKNMKGIPIIANCDFGHTIPCVSIPIGEKMNISVVDGNVDIMIGDY